MAAERRSEARGWRWGRAAVALVAAAVMGGVPVAPAGADAGGGAVLPPTGLVASDCAGAVPVVVGSDAAAQSDIYSAVTLAGVVGTDCVILAGARDGVMAADQRARLDAAASGGFVVGGTAAVPDAKLAGHNLTRIAGADRWSTAQQVGMRARTLAGGGGLDAPELNASLSVPADVKAPGVHLSGAGPWVASDCAGKVPIVVGSDLAAQSDIYSAITLAGVAGTDCVILAGPRDGNIAASQKTRLEAAAAGGFVVGGTAAVPTVKIAGRDMTRLAGTDRWETAQLVGRRASGDTTAGTPTTTEDPEEGESDGETSESEEANPEEEEVTEEEGVIPDPISPNQAWIAHNIEVERIIDECGYYDTASSAYLECDNPEDTDALVQMMSDFLGCEFDNRAGLCKGYSSAAHWELESSLACPNGLLLSFPAGSTGHVHDLMCSHPDHPDFDFPG